MRKICVFTGTRAEYGLLKCLMERLKRTAGVTLQILASAMHLSPEFGLTYREIESDGFLIDEKIEMLLSSDTPIGTTKSMGIGLIGFGEALARLQPDIMVILGDRFEAFTCAAAATVMRIPIAHIHGGEITQGCIDEALRHSITKMSHLHFTSTETYRQRVVQMGENPGRVFNVGAPGIDGIKSLKLMGKDELEGILNYSFGLYNLLVTFHPTTLEGHSSRNHFNNLLSALDMQKDAHILFTKANADPEGREINAMVDEYVSKNPGRARVFTSMGQRVYFSAIQFVDAVVGNSSSGIIEAPSFKIATVNIGNRQKGRIRAESVIDCEPTEDAISRALEKAVSRKFKERLSLVENPYGNGGSSERIAEILVNYELGGLLDKEFFDGK